MILALVIGDPLIAQLWTQPLSQDSLTTAGRGGLFVLLALGLMGTRRPSIMLTTVLCSVSLADLLSVDHTHKLQMRWRCCRSCYAGGFY